MYRLLVKLCFVAFHMSSNSVGASPVDNEATIFDSGDLLNFNMPASCLGESFCFDKGDEYPEGVIEKLLHKLPILPFKDRTGTDLTFREGSENPDCPTNNTFADKPIYYIVDENDNVRAVVQSENFTQIYSAKWCQRPGPISYDTLHFLKGSHTLTTFKIECVNTYMNFDFLVLTDEGQVEIVKAKNGIPVCCRCRYSKPGTCGDGGDRDCWWSRAARQRVNTSHAQPDCK